MEKWCLSVERNKAVSQRKHFIWSVKITYEKALQNLLICYLLFAGSLENLIQKKRDATERKDSIVKSRKIYIYIYIYIYMSLFFGGGSGF